MPRALILDIDGTLVDSNYLHVVAWHRAFREHGLEAEAWIIHRYVGKGGDKMVASVAGRQAEEDCGDEVRETEAEEFKQLMGEVRPLEGATCFIESMKGLGFTVVLSSSAKADEVDRYIERLAVGELIDGYTTSADVVSTKPEPDLIEAALEMAGTRDAVMIGDSIWDVEAARRSGLACHAVLTGGFSKAELLAAGAADVQPSLEDLRGFLPSGSPDADVPGADPVRIAQ